MSNQEKIEIDKLIEWLEEHTFWEGKELERMTLKDLQAISDRVWDAYFDACGKAPTQKEVT